MVNFVLQVWSEATFSYFLTNIFSKNVRLPWKERSWILFTSFQSLDLQVM